MSAVDLDCSGARRRRRRCETIPLFAAAAGQGREERKGLSPRNRIDTGPGGRRVIFYISRALVCCGGTAAKTSREEKEEEIEKQGETERGRKNPVDRILNNNKTHTNVCVNTTRRTITVM